MERCRDGLRLYELGQERREAKLPAENGEHDNDLAVGDSKLELRFHG